MTPGKVVKEGGGSGGTSSSRPRSAMLMERRTRRLVGVARCAAVEMKQSACANDGSGWVATG